MVSIELLEPRHVAGMGLPSGIAANWFGSAVAAVDDGKTVGIFGMYGSGMPLFTAYITDDLRKRKFELTRRCRQALDAIQAAYGIAAVGLEVRPGDKRAARWAGALGFTLAKSGDVDLYVRSA